MSTLVLIRHGESRWNQCNRFTGWIDVPLSERGMAEAEECAEHCKQFDFSAAFTSKLERAHGTMFITLSKQNRTGIVQHEHDTKYYQWVKRSNNCTTGEIPIFESTHLNERYYGALQGMDKEAAEKKYGKEKVMNWRRGYSARPPGGGESLEDTSNRVLPYVKKHIFPRIKKGEQILVVAHGNTLRAVVKYLEKISDEDIAKLDLPEAQPLIYKYIKGEWKRILGGYQFDRPLR
ncbi:MAG: 2,3-bisphosphoglycerate-dependent phosphoglycerate mutase [Candidatus Uhrbacteria bacterium]